MKKTSIVSLCSVVILAAAAVGLSAVNMVNNTDSAATTGKHSVNLSNIKAAQASAGEWYCDPINTNMCKSYLDGVELISTGILVYKP